jgi:Na+-transporting NADH:ubiquinone oxidoreductase subunit NqrE
MENDTFSGGQNVKNFSVLLDKYDSTLYLTIGFYNVLFQDITLINTKSSFSTYALTDWINIFLGLQTTAIMSTQLATSSGSAVPAISIDEITNSVQQMKVEREIPEGKITRKVPKPT